MSGSLVAWIVLVGLAAAAMLAALALRAHRAAREACRRHTRLLEDEIVAHRRTQDELGRAKEAAEAANAAKTRYLVAVSHEIRSPLNAIYGYAQLLERADAITPAEAGGVIRRSTEHLTNLVEGLLDISRIESGVLQLRRDVVRLPALLDQVVEMFRMQAQAKNLALEYVVEGRLPPFVRTDEKRLRQILINLLSNAIKYTSAGGATLKVRYRSQTAFIEVSDTGIGIPAADIERIFEPFERGTAPEAALQPGIGLGLAITRVLARILGGEVTAISEAGAGSSFQLRMLLPEPMAAPESVGTHERLLGYRGDRRTILIIDDDAAQLTVVQHLLRPLGFEVFAATNGIDGLALAERCAPDLVLLDVQMPGLTGWDVAGRLRAAFGERLRVAMVSANAHEYRAGNDGSAHHDVFLTKPVDLDGLVDMIGEQLGISWIIAGGESADAPVDLASAKLPAAAISHVNQLRQHVKVGHVRAIAAVLDEMEADVPDSAASVAEMRHLLERFDLRALARRIDDGA